jgi:hypothetical protein
LNSSIFEISSLLDGKIDDPKKFIKTILYDFYDMTHTIDIEILEIFNESLKDKIKNLGKSQEIN